MAVKHEMLSDQLETLIKGGSQPRISNSDGLKKVSKAWNRLLILTHEASSDVVIDSRRVT
ncbi:predicted protein [Plenodomus lingam JN3]|uniref:Uncharacterized protein n=1 Tax=Leptosphaeria maculans (strain JN3 / isolate v23.1.3 / race Av1-4-5-6-7-8) TaxID=985895 RepID=E5A7D5_LEPMJ|nr:predicted protein [Plenodomus lingam JN3]CBX99530.1 predicted protein [Plenodomus lingam JN3]